MAKVIIGVEGMSCNHCKMAVEKELKSLQGVKDAVVSLESKNAEIEYDENMVDIEKLRQAIKDAGYTPV